MLTPDFKKKFKASEMNRSFSSIERKKMMYFGRIFRELKEKH